MDKTALVGMDVERGSEVIAALDEAGIGLNVALWAVLPEYEDWRLYLAGRGIDSVGTTREGYGLILPALRVHGITVERTPPLQILPMKDPLVKELRSVFAKSASVEGMRLGGQIFGKRFIEDAYVYRIR